MRKNSILKKLFKSRHSHHFKNRMNKPKLRKRLAHAVFIIYVTTL